MTAAGHTSTRGDELLLRHCAALTHDRPSAAERLERALGPELSRILMTALATRGLERRAA